MKRSLKKKTKRKRKRAKEPMIAWHVWLADVSYPLNSKWRRIFQNHVFAKLVTLNPSQYEGARHHLTAINRAAI